MPGLHVKVTATGAGYFLYYRTKAGKERRPRLGDVRALSIPQAREVAREMLFKVSKGEDPGAELAAIKARPTITDLRDRYMAEHANVKKKPRPARQDRGKFDKIIIPRLGANTAVADVVRADWAAIHHALRATPYHANRTIALGHKAFELAEAWGWRPEYSNPVRVERYKEHRRKRVPSKDEVLRLLAAMDAMRVDRPEFIGFLDLLCFTGARPDEIRTARREWVGEAGLTLPDAKTGGRVVQLNEFARAAIEGLPVIVGNPYLIPGSRRRGPLGNYHRPWRDLCEKAGIKCGREGGGLIVYDLKRFFASAGIGGGLSLETMGQLMGHTSYQTTRGYAFLLTDAAAQASQTAGEAVKTLMSAGAAR